MSAISSSPAGRRSSSTRPSSRSTCALVSSSVAVAASRRLRRSRARVASCPTGGSMPRCRPSAASSAMEAAGYGRVHVVRHLREQADRRDPVRRRCQFEDREARRRDAQQPIGSLPDPLREQSRGRCGRQDRHRARVRHRRRDRAHAHPRHDAQALGHLDDVGGELAPSVVRLRAAQDEQITAADAGGGELELRPIQVHRAPVDDVERRAARPVVVDRIGVEGGDDGAVLGELRSRRRSRRCPRRPSPRARRRSPARRALAPPRADMSTCEKDTSHDRNYTLGMPKRSADAPPDPDKLTRQSAGSYRTADDRFEARQAAQGWFLVDTEQSNEFGQELIHGPFATLKELREAIPDSRTTKTVPMSKPPKAAKTRREPRARSQARAQDLGRQAATRRGEGGARDDGGARAGRDHRRRAPHPARPRRSRSRHRQPAHRAAVGRGRRWELVAKGTRTIIQRVAEILSAEGRATDALPGWTLVEVPPGQGPPTDHRRIDLRK